MSSLFYMPMVQYGNHWEITQLLLAIHQLQEVSVIYCKGNQKGMDEVSEGNILADSAAKLATRSTTPSLGWLYNPGKTLLFS